MVSVTSNLTGCLYELLTFFFGNIVCPQEVKKNNPVFHSVCTCDCVDCKKPWEMMLRSTSPTAEV